MIHILMIRWGVDVPLPDLEQPKNTGAARNLKSTLQSFYGVIHKDAGKH